MGFKELGLRTELITSLEKEHILVPTQVQEAIFSKITQKKDLMVQSKTGTGKTLAYLLPIMQQLIPEERGSKVIILTPTYELAMQIHKQMERIAKNSGLALLSVPIIGNANIKHQIEQLKKKPQIVVGTSGRILELIKLKKISAHLVQTVVIDEADKMLDKQNFDLTRSVIKCCLRDVQKLFFSASMDKEAVTKAIEIAPKTVMCKVKESIHVQSNIRHICVVVEYRDKIEMLRKMVSSINPKKAMVFMNKVPDIEAATRKLQYHKYNAQCIHGKASKESRKRLIADFHKNKVQILMATDVAARGLHFDDVSTVFHLSIPEEPKIYLHRAGRTGRNGKEGLSILIVTEKELKIVQRYQNCLEIQIPKKKLYQGKIVTA